MPNHRRLLYRLAVLLAVPSAAASVAPAQTTATPAERAFQRGDYAGAITLARSQLLARPDDVAARVVGARAEAALGRIEVAYEGFQEALKRDPHDPDALYYLGITAGLLAQGAYQQLFALAPGSARAHQLLAESLEAQGRRPEAEAEWKAALAAKPKSVEALVALGDLGRAQLRFAEALDYYARASVLAPGNYDVVYGTGVCHLFRGERAQALASFREALRLRPASASARLALGTVLLQNGQAEAAVPELLAAVTQRPRLRQAHYQLGRAYQALGRTVEAEAEFARVRELMHEQLDAEDELIAPTPP